MSSASTDSPPSAVSPSALAWEVATRVPLALLCARYAGFAFQRLRLPQISAHLLVGVLAGPHVSGLVGASLTSRLAWVDETCLAVIGVAAGSELRLAELRKNPRPTLAMVASLVVVTWVFVFTAFLAVGRRLAFLAELGPAHVVAVGSLVATLAVARSPASAIAILREMDARGPFCARVLEVTVVKDVVVVLLFALNLELVAISGVRFDPSTLDPRPLDDDDDGSRNLPGRSPGAKTLALVAALARPAASLVGSVLAGGVAGVGLGHVLRLGAAAVLPTTAERGAPGAAPRGGEGTLRGRAFVVLRPALVLACSASAFLAASFARLEPLLLCVAAGAVAANRRHERGDAERRALGACVDALAPGTNLAFFTLAGAALPFASVSAARTAGVAACVVCARLFALYHAAPLGCDLGGDDVAGRAKSAGDRARSSSPGGGLLADAAERRLDAHRSAAWMGYVTQAGVALGLSRVAVARFPEMGDEFAAVSAAAIVANQIIGPPMFRRAIVLAGEDGRRGGEPEGAGGGGKEEEGGGA